MHTHQTHLPMQETQETQVQSLGQEDPLRQEMESHSSILAWEIPWKELDETWLQTIESEHRVTKSWM